MSEGASPERSAGGADGFTLIEMLVTLAILALAVTFGARSIVVAQSARQPARVAAILAAELDRLRAEALRSGTTGRLAYDPDVGRFLSSRPGAPPIPAEALQVAVEVPPSGRPVPDEIRLLPDGSASGGRILLQAPRGGATVTVAPLTGRVRWEARS